MTTISVTRNVAATQEAVFDTVAHIENFAKAVPDIMTVEFLSTQKSGVGTRVRETRRTSKGGASTDMEVTLYEPHERVEYFSDSAGSLWEISFAVDPKGSESVDLTMTMTAKPQGFLAKLLIRFIKGMIRDGIEKDLNSAQSYCERHDPPTEPH